MTEAKVQHECLVWLNQNGFYAWRNNSTGLFDPKAGRYRKPQGFAISGVSDIIAFRDGITYFIEVKGPMGELRKSQAAFGAQCARRGVPYMVVRSLEELVGRFGYELEECT